MAANPWVPPNQAAFSADPHVWDEGTKSSLQWGRWQGEEWSKAHPLAFSPYHLSSIGSLVPKALSMFTHARAQTAESEHGFMGGGSGVGLGTSYLASLPSIANLNFDKLMLQPNNPPPSSVRPQAPSVPAAAWTDPRHVAMHNSSEFWEMGLDISEQFGHDQATRDITQDPEQPKVLHKGHAIERDPSSYKSLTAGRWTPPATTPPVPSFYPSQPFFLPNYLPGIQGYTGYQLPSFPQQQYPQQQYPQQQYLSDQLAQMYM